MEPPTSFPYACIHSHVPQNIMKLYWGGLPNDAWSTGTIPRYEGWQYRPEVQSLGLTMWWYIYPLVCPSEDPALLIWGGGGSRGCRLSSSWDLHLTLHSTFRGITPGRLRELFGMPGAEPEWAPCKTSVLPTVLPLWPLHYHFLFCFVFEGHIWLFWGWPCAKKALLACLRVHMGYWGSNQHQLHARSSLL